jgi:hypothetical protein
MLSLEFLPKVFTRLPTTFRRRAGFIMAGPELKLKVVTDEDNN